MVNKKKLQFSCDIFWGFQVEIDFDDYDDLESIIDFAVISLFSFLQSNNLLTLIDKLKDKINIKKNEIKELYNNNIDFNHNELMPYYITENSIKKYVNPYHIHDVTYDELLLKEPEENGIIGYICGHKENCN